MSKNLTLYEVHSYEKTRVKKYSDHRNFVLFHAMQSILVFGGLTLISILIGSTLLFFVFLIPLLNFLGVILWILLMVKAYQGDFFKLPIIGDQAEKLSAP